MAFEVQALSLRRLRLEAERMAGRNGDFAQRAAVYHYLTRHSRGNHLFPLLAAHGALWGASYFAAGMRIGSLLKWRFAQPVRQEAMAGLNAFAEAFRDINRRVCIETYFTYMATADAALHERAAEVISPILMEALLRCHAARRSGRSLSESERRGLFGAFFLWEQEAVVSDAVAQAFAAFHWPEVAWLARRPSIGFTYLPKWRPLRFADFGDPHERIARGFDAYDAGQRQGWDHVEGSLCSYGKMPADFRTDSSRHFQSIRRSALQRMDDQSLVFC